MNTLNTLPKSQSNTSPEGVNLGVSQQFTAIIAIESDVSDFNPIIDSELARLTLTETEACEARIRMENSFFYSLSRLYEWLQKEFILTLEREQLLTPFWPVPLKLDTHSSLFRRKI